MRGLFAIRADVNHFILSAVAGRAVAMAGIHPANGPACGRGQGVEFPVGVRESIKESAARRAGYRPHVESVA